MDKVKAGVIGAWWRSINAHCPALSKMDDIEISAICELQKDRLDSAAEKFGIQGKYTDYKLMLKEMDLDVVYAIMRPQNLDPIITYCLNHGKNVFVDKPPGIDVEETRKWAKLAKKNDCKTMVGFQRRFHPCVSTAKKVVEERGNIMHCIASFHKWNEIAHTYAAEDHLTHDVIHVVDLLRWFGGDVKKVHSLSGQLFNSRPNHLNFYTALLEYENGGVGILNSNRKCGGREVYFEIHSNNISAYGNIPDRPGLDHYTVMKDNKKIETVQIEQLIGKEKAMSAQIGYAPLYYGLYQMTRHFIDCLKQDKQPVTNFEDATKTMQVIKDILSGPKLSSVF